MTDTRIKQWVRKVWNPHVRLKLSQSVYTALALALISYFAIWWFVPGHISHNFTGWLRSIDVLLFLCVSYVIWHPVIMEVLNWAIASHIRPLAKRKPSPGLRVAFITTFVPGSESADLLAKTLPAMVKAKYPHDTWLLDEGNNLDAKLLCQKYGVNHFTRYGNQALNTPTGKFTKTKGGNHNSWYETVGSNYDIVAQIDTDFIPKRDFLTRTLGYFRDPKIAFVGTPQIYGNTNESFIARGAAEQQYNFYGSVLQGLSSMGMTLLIGANHVIRVSALKQVNHYSAHITEDLLTGMKLHRYGWKSVYVPHALAVGEGPQTWDAYFNQQMRWAYGCIDILAHHSFKHFRQMGLRQSIYYFFLQQHYFSGLAMGIGVGLVSLYFMFGIQAATVDITVFTTIYSLVLISNWLMSVWLQRFEPFRDSQKEVLVAGQLINIAAWPIWFLACLSVVTGKRLSYKVTPKGDQAKGGTNSILGFMPHMAFGVIALSDVVSAAFTHRHNPMMLWWACLSLLVLGMVPILHHVTAALAICNRWLTTVVAKMKATLATEDINEVMVSNTYTIMDYIFLSAITIISQLLYIFKLGFYSDDWSFISRFVLAANQSIFNLFRVASTPNTFMRPVQNIYDVMLYKMFGINPLGYHVINALVIVAIAMMFYHALRFLRVPRTISLTIPLLYILMPNYATDKFWFASYQANLSMFFYFVSLVAGLRSLDIRRYKLKIWKFISIISLCLSVLSYEIILPFFIINCGIYWFVGMWGVDEVRRSKYAKSKYESLVVLTLCALIYMLVFKLKTVTRLDSSAAHSSFHLFVQIYQVIMGGVKANFGTFGISLLHVLLTIAGNYYDPLVGLFGLGVGMSIFVYLFIRENNQLSGIPNKHSAALMLIGGLLLFIAGYAIFFIVGTSSFAATGMDNRIAIVAAIGVAIIIIGLLVFMSHMLDSPRAKRIVFSLSVASLCAASFIITNTVADFWVKAYDEQKSILSDMYANIPIVDKNTTIILDGICQYVGPASVFEAQWDLKGALQIHYRDSTLQADSVGSRFAYTQQGLETHIYNESQLYPYNEDHTIVYNYQNKHITELRNYEDAKSYFEDSAREKESCPKDQEGVGVQIF
jgi:cellulose synthase/poly-beta-1,6-N-acetylglucosamine synthase-like glycosyltransferase